MTDTINHKRTNIPDDLLKQMETEREILTRMTLDATKKGIALGSDKKIIEQSNKLNVLLNRYDELYNGL